MFSTISYEQPLLHTTVIDTRHDGGHKVIDMKPLTSVFNMPIYRCGLKPDEFCRASANRTSDPGPTRINSGPGSEALVWTWPKYAMVDPGFVKRVGQMFKFVKRGDCMADIAPNWLNLHD